MDNTKPFVAGVQHPMDILRTDKYRGMIALPVTQHGGMVPTYVRCTGHLLGHALSDYWGLVGIPRYRYQLTSELYATAEEAREAAEVEFRRVFPAPTDTVTNPLIKTLDV